MAAKKPNPFLAMIEKKKEKGKDKEGPAETKAELKKAKKK